MFIDPWLPALLSGMRWWKNARGSSRMPAVRCSSDVGAGTSKVTVGWQARLYLADLGALSTLSLTRPTRTPVT